MERAVVESEISGRIVVMDCVVDGVLLRRMIFGEGESLIQTESQLVVEDLAQMENLKEVPRDPASLGVLLTKLTAEYHQFIAKAIEIMKNEDSLLKRVLIVGLGGGVLPMYLHQVLDLNITVVELDPKIVEIAEEWFGFDQKIPVVIEDGVHYFQTLKVHLTLQISVDFGSRDRRWRFWSLMQVEVVVQVRCHVLQKALLHKSLFWLRLMHSQTTE